MSRVPLLIPLEVLIPSRELQDKTIPIVYVASSQLQVVFAVLYDYVFPAKAKWVKFRSDGQNISMKYILPFANIHHG